MTLRNTLALTLALLAAAAARADDPEPLTVDEIIAKTNHVAYYQGKDGRANVTMTITDDAGQKRYRRFIILRRDVPATDGADGDQQFYVYFRLPADVKNMAFLVHKHTAADRQDDRWLYLPGMDLVKRISSAEKRTPFVGSDYFYEDVSGRNLTDDHHKLVRTTDAYYVIENTPKDPDSVEFSSYRMFVHRKTFLPVRVTYYDKSATPKKYRQYDVLDTKKIKGEAGDVEYVTPVRAVMRDLVKKTQTTLEYAAVRYDIGVPADVFTERRLRTPPREWLR